jgi:hypothetical protein
MTLLFGAVYGSSAQNTMKLRYPSCALVNETVRSEVKGIKTFEITTQEEFDKYFTLTDDTKINFETDMVLAAIVGTDKDDKFIHIDAASFISSKARSLYVRYDIRDEEQVKYAKYSAVVVKRPNYKKVFFMKGKFYNMAISGD